MKDSEKLYPYDIYFVNQQNESVAADSLTQKELAEKLTAMQLAFIRQGGYTVAPKEK